MEGGDELVSVGDEPDGFSGDFIGGALVTFPANSVEQTLHARASISKINIRERDIYIRTPFCH